MFLFDRGIQSSVFEMLGLETWIKKQREASTEKSRLNSAKRRTAGVLKLSDLNENGAQNVAKNQMQLFGVKSPGAAGKGVKSPAGATGGSTETNQINSIATQKIER